jgi:SAM-dependent methyltransferase
MDELDETAFTSTWRLLAPHVKQLEHAVPATAVDLVRSQIRGDLSVNYEADARAFAVAFLGPNYWKTAAAISATAPSPPKRIVDLGSGGGAAGLAGLAYSAAHTAAAAHEIQFVDTSKSQLYEARAAVEAALPSFPYEVTSSYSHENVTDWVNSHLGWADLAIASHLLTESPSTAGELTRQLARAVSPGGTLLIVERADDELVCDAAADAADQAALPLNRHVGTAWVPGETRRAQWKVQAIAIGQPRISWFPDLILRYFEAWNKAEPGLLSEVFTTEATYSEKPWRTPLRGLGEIFQYWNSEVRAQYYIDARPLAVTYYGYRAILEWQSTFTKDALDYRVDGMMLLDADPHRKKISNLREIFRASKNPSPGAGLEP